MGKDSALARDSISARIESRGGQAWSKYASMSAKSMFIGICWHLDVV